LAIRGKAPGDDVARFHAMSLLGEALLRQHRYSEAEHLVVEGYEGMKQRQARIPALAKPRLLMAAERVVLLYEEWQRSREADEWKRRLGMPDLPASLFARP
jgi:hypothetical protein